MYWLENNTFRCICDKSFSIHAQILLNQSPTLVARVGLEETALKS